MPHKASESAAVSSDPHLPVGTLIDGDSLELVEVLRVGEASVVYRAVDTRSPTPKSYAVKCLVAKARQTDRQWQHHFREIALHQTASSHPGVVTIHRVVEDFMIMDYAPDHNLCTQILQSRYLGDDDLINHVFLQLLDAVEYCHSLGIYHRDLKPENVLCFDEGLRVAIADFGLATTEKLSKEFHIGSIAYMSPECQGGEFAPTGNYSPIFNDIWSLGIILLNLATGRSPWQSATSDDQIFCAYLRDPFGFLPTVFPISSESNDVLTRMLEVDWRKRMTLRELRHAIEGIQAFYSTIVILEGSVARCPWEAGMDAGGESEKDKPRNVLPPISTDLVDFISHWSQKSDSDIVVARHDPAGSLAQDLPYARVVYSSSRVPKALEYPFTFGGGKGTRGSIKVLFDPGTPLADAPVPVPQQYPWPPPTLAPSAGPMIPPPVSRGDDTEQSTGTLFFSGTPFVGTPIPMPQQHPWPPPTLDPATRSAITPPGPPSTASFTPAHLQTGETQSIQMYQEPRPLQQQYLRASQSRRPTTKPAPSPTSSTAMTSSLQEEHTDHQHASGTPVIAESKTSAHFTGSTIHENDYRPAQSQRPLHTDKNMANATDRLQALWDNTEDYRRILTYKDIKAQRLLNIFQRLLDILTDPTPTSFRRNLIVATQRLARASGLYPVSYELTDVTIPELSECSGGFADIYKGDFRGRAVCVKTVRLHSNTDMPHFLKIVSKEAILWCQLRHPNLLPFYGIYHYKSRISLVAPWMDNGDIGGYLKHHKTSNRVVLAYDVAQGLDFLHNNGIIHGDLKGSNILVNELGRACLADFGLSSISDKQILAWTSYSSAASKGGTVRWQAPELFDPEGDEEKHNSKASDTYAWACVAYEIFAGQLPFAHLTREATIMSRVLNGERPAQPLVSNDSWSVWGLTEDIWSLMEACWSAQPEARPSVQSVIDLVASVLTPTLRAAATDSCLSSGQFREMMRGSSDENGLTVEILDSLLSV